MSQEKITASLRENKRYLDERLGVKKNFDVISRELEVGGKAACIYFVDGFCKDEVMQKLLQYLMDLTAEDMPKSATELAEKKMPYGEVDLTDEWDQVLYAFFSGVFLLLIEGYDQVVLIDSRTYPARSVDEPDKDKVLRGSKDGFVETIVFNTALIRRRIRSDELRMEMLSAGKSSKTDIVICYMADRVDRKLLAMIRQRIQNLQVDALTMNQQSLAEALFKRKWFNPFPKFKFTERPDTAAACLLEGKIILLVDNSPSALVVPTSNFDMIEEANDHYFPPITNIYLKVSRAIITVLTIFVVPLFLLLMQNPQWVPKAFDFVVVRDTVNVPLIYQILILELAIDGLRLAALNTPSMLSTPLSVIAGIVMGEFSVQSGWFNSEVMLYMAFVSVANYTQPNFELGYALKFMRLLLLILTAVFNLVGFVIGCVIVIWCICVNKTLSGKSYLNVKLP